MMTNKGLTEQYCKESHTVISDSVWGAIAGELVCVLLTFPKLRFGNVNVSIFSHVLTAVYLTSFGSCRILVINTETGFQTVPMKKISLIT
jgi:hypothetical protein